MNETRVLYSGGSLRSAAGSMLPRLPDDCFVQAVDIEEAAREAAADGLAQLIVFVTADTLGHANVRAPLAEITSDMGGTPELAAAVGRQEAIPSAYRLWHEAGLLGKCGRELCRRVAGDLEGAANGSVATQVVLLDPPAERMVGMYGRLGR